jgi:four helix bundle protein
MLDIKSRTFNFSVRIVRLHQHLIKSGETSKILANQILRSGTSIGANLEEAQAGQSKADFLSKCSISLKEARETHYWLRVLAACNLISTEKLAPITQEANEIIAILTTIVKRGKENRN